MCGFGGVMTMSGHFLRSAKTATSGPTPKTIVGRVPSTSQLGVFTTRCPLVFVAAATNRRLPVSATHSRGRCGYSVTAARSVLYGVGVHDLIADTDLSCYVWNMKRWFIAFAAVAAVLIGLLPIPVVRSVAEVVLLQATAKTELQVSEDTLYMNGTVTSKTPQQLIDVFEQHPGISTVVMQNVPGSIDDDANLKASRWLAAKGLTFRLEPTSEISSGGTDMFLAGKIRIVSPGAKIGVHAWRGVKPATAYPDDSPEHLPYINYYKSLGWTEQEAKDFYFFTIRSAPDTDIHWMTPAEITKYRVATQPFGD